MGLQVKFKGDAPAEVREGILGRLAAEGAGQAQAVFPDSDDTELNSLYVVDSGSASEEQLLSYLEEEDAVEIAEPEVRRRLASGPS